MRSKLFSPSCLVWLQLDLAIPLTLPCVEECVAAFLWLLFPSPALHNRIIWRKYPGLNTKCPISKEGKGDWIGKKTELDKDTAISITNTEDSSEAIGQNKDYIHPQLVWVQAPHLKMSSEVYKWCQGGGGWVAAALLFLNNF